MKIKLDDLAIDKDDPFKNCLFNREKYADILNKVISNYNKNIVMAVNSEWGTGKSTFLRMWQQKLTNTGFLTVYFNAWENDFEDEPLTALLGELSAIQPSSKKNFDKVLDVAKNFAIEFLPAAAKGIAKKYISEDAIDIVESGLDGSSALVKKLLVDYSVKKVSLIKFREEIGKVIKNLSPNRPLVFFIDELDRCRPNYAVSILEKIKHFFNVSNIIFVLAIDKEQLSHSVCGVYNSEKINSKEYLRRFIDIEYSMPNDSKENYVKYLINYYQINEDLQNNDKHFRTKEEDQFYHLIWNLFHGFNLRKLEKTLGLIKLSLISVNSEKIYPEIHLLLIYLKLEKPDLYNKILKKKFSMSEFYKELNDLTSFYLKLEVGIEILEFHAIMMICYGNYLSPTALNEFIHSAVAEVQSLIQSFKNLQPIYGHQCLNANLETFIYRIEITNDFNIA
ncbi:P-loop NTPase fold protein [uncultured Chryseobacterium sp.]|uniref:KAP family P-loop NTPase fold protein n=1 Tax=uncultured Chryseobacterium sp. TaxID=259322 RepID=UPI0025EE2790|nr:P-loop NTPase fold protein [uncultured Chryseobacterium sp.]